MLIRSRYYLTLICFFSSASLIWQDGDTSQITTKVTLKNYVSAYSRWRDGTGTQSFEQIFYDSQTIGFARSGALLIHSQKAITNKTGRPLGLVVNARGGSSINSWMKGAKDNYYDEALSRIRQAMKFGTLKAIIWHQGESDSNAPETYILKLQELVANLRKDLNNARLPFIVGELAEWRINGTSETFNEMLRTVPQHIPYSYCVSSKELVPLIDENDPHFSADSQIILGRRYADAAYKACYSEE